MPYTRTKAAIEAAAQRRRLDLAVGSAKLPTTNVSIRIPVQEHAIFQAVAALSHSNISTFIRDAAIDVAIDIITREGINMSEWQEKQRELALEAARVEVERQLEVAQDRIARLEAADRQRRREEQERGRQNP